MSRSDHDRNEAKAEDEQRPASKTELLYQLAGVLDGLGVDADYFIAALTQKLRALRPVDASSTLVGPERRFLIRSGAFTESGLADLEAAVARGSLQLYEAQAWTFLLLDTLSFEEASRRLRLSERKLRRAVHEGDVLSFTVAGQLRFPRWQFDAASNGGLLRGLRDIVTVLPADAPEAWAALMHSPADELIGRGARTPLQWLRDGGEVARVLALLEEDEYWS